MNLIAISLPEIIGLTILHSLWQITLLWIVLITVLRLCPRASSAVRYTFAISTLLLSVLATAVTVIYEWQSYTTIEEISTLPERTTETMHTLYVTAKQTLLSRLADALNASVPILAWLWCAGLMVMSTRFGGSFFYLRKLRARENISAVPPIWEEEIKRLSIALGLRYNVAIATSSRISSPIALGNISPIILLPAGLLSGMSTAQIEAILVHELYHIKRRDYIINICQALVEALLFYHPAIWHINNIIRDERENCCDDQTLAFCGDAMTYARALTQIQEINILTKPTLAMSATGRNAGNFSNRIKRLFNIYPNPAQARSKGIFAIGFLVVYLGIVLASANISTALAIEPEKETATTSVDDYHTLSNALPDSIPTSNHPYAGSRKEIIPHPSSAKKIRLMDIQRADTTVKERTLNECLQKVRLLLKTVSYGQRFNFTPLALEPRPTFYGTMNLSRIKTLGVVDTTDSETSKNITLEKIPQPAVDSITLHNGAETIDRYGDDSKGVSVQVFPNATNGRLSISFTPAHDNSHVKMVLSDSDGNMVEEITDSTYDNIPAVLHVDVSGYKKGIYILQINIAGEKSQQRVGVE
jgi:beta-lactamase regulating signal transducer with metallopeptidase domain